MITCSQCGAENSNDLPTCRMCVSPLGTALIESSSTAAAPPEFIQTIIEAARESPEIKCLRCSALNEPGYKFCQECGAKLVNATAVGAAEVMEASPISQAQTPLLARKAASPDHYKTTPSSDLRLPCPHCANEMPRGSVFCNLCGTRLSIDQTLVMPSPKPALKYRLRVIVDGEESEEVYPLGSKAVIGRIKGDINFPYDDYMSSRHASVTRRGDRFVLQDEESRNGTFKMLDGEVELKPGDVFMVGKQLFKFEADE